MSIIIFLIILAILILVHEFGHFIVAKKSGIRVDEFGLGFPPKIWSKRFGDTTYTLNALPFGGFVKIFGEDSHSEVISEKDRSTSFFYKPKWIQALVLVAGVTFNIIFAWLLISLSFVIGNSVPVDYSVFGKVTNIHTIITEVLPNSPAEKVGLKAGDKIVSVSSGNNVLNESNLLPKYIQELINESDEKVEINYDRNNKPEQVVVYPDTTIVSGKKAIGIGMDQVGILKLPIHLALLEGARTSYFLIKATSAGLFSFLGKTILFKSDFSQVSGPIGIASIVGEATKLGFNYIITLTALISINLAIINLLPFPALDGGRLLFIGIEAITRRPIKPSFVRWTNTVGFALLIILMVVVTGHDILKLL